MKKAVSVILMMCMVLMVLSGCSNIKQEDYDKVVSELEEAKSAIETMTSENSETVKEFDKLKTN